MSARASSFFACESKADWLLKTAHHWLQVEVEENLEMSLA